MQGKLEEKLEESSELESTKLDSGTFWQRATDLYFEPKNIEKWRKGRIYELLGVKQFKRLILKIGDLAEQENNPYRRSQSELNSKEKLANLDYTTRVAELIHSPVALLFAYQTADNLAGGDYVRASINGAVCLLNAYCSMTQRYHRTRISRIVEKIESRN